MIVDAKTKSYSWKIDVSEALPTGMVETKLVFQRPGEPDEIVIEKVSTVSSVKQMMDGIFRELYIATQTKTN